MSQVQQATGAEQIIWDLSDLYAGIDDPNITRDLEAAIARAERFASRYRGKVAALNAAELAEALIEGEQIGEQLGRIFSFSSLLWNTETSNAAYGALLQKTREAFSRLQQQTLFFELEWVATPDDTAAALIADPALERWKHYLGQQRRYKPHVLSEPEEKILTEKDVTGRSAFSRMYGEIVNGIEYDWDGRKVPQSVVLRQLYMADREVRIKAADSVTNGLRPHLRNVTFIHNTLLADKASTDRLRKYPTWISSRNLDNETTDQAVDALVQAVTSRYDIVARYYRLKRKLLGLDTLYDYDRYAPLSSKTSHYTWDQARSVVLTAFNAFDPKMAEIANEFFERRWIHAPILPGKRGGAFASPTVPSHHPYVFVNFSGIGRDVMTLAHELGHGIHMYLSRPKGYYSAYTPLTTAEMASVFGEMLVFTNLIAVESDPEVKLAMLASKIEDNFATVFRQISMNRFEHGIHTARRNDGELTTDKINQIWMETQRAMFGDSLTLRDDYSIWWSYVSHFVNTPGYVYAYAFGDLLVMALFNRYKQEGKAFVPRYLDVLSAGGSDNPESILARVGVNLADPTFWQEGLAAIDALVTECESLAAQVAK